MDFLGEIGKGIILVYGESATGKSTFGLQSSLNVAKEGKVLFLDCDGSFSLDRIKKMDSECSSYLDRFLVVNLKDLLELDSKLEQFEKMVDKFDLVVLDNIGLYYRLGLKENYVVTNSIIVRILRKLRHMSEEIPVIIISQVYEMDEGKKVLGGKMIQNFSDYVVELSKEPRKFKLMKPEEKEFLFKLEDKGLVKI
jgi:RecA/RadA recombinase